MALTSYMKVKGKSQGEIKGDCTQSGDKKDTMLIYQVDHLVEIPKDTHTGLPTGTAYPPSADHYEALRQRLPQAETGLHQRRAVRR